jgi:hypothetical protein
LQDAEEAERRDKMNGAESLVRTLVGEADRELRADDFGQHPR